MDPFTFGKTMAAINLADLLSKPENKAYCARIGKALTIHNQMVNFIDLVGHKELPARQGLLKLVKQSMKNRLDNMVAPPIVKSHCLNVFTKNWRMAYNLKAKRNDWVKKHE